VNYIKLDGNVGCMVNGAGLAMTTMDLIKMAGGEPANSSTWAAAHRRNRSRRPFASSPRSECQCILVNIFGGVLRCDRVSAGLIQARPISK